MSEPRHYAIHVTEPEDCWLYYIDPSIREEPIGLVALQRRGWWAGPDALTEVTLRPGDRRVIDCYRLAEGVRIEGRPEEITRAERAELDDADPVAALYEPVYRVEPADPVTFTAVEVGRFDMADYPLPWAVNLPWAVREFGGLAEAFPGEFTGVRGFVEDALKAAPGVKFAFLRRNRGSDSYVTVHVPLAPSQHQPARGRKGTKSYQRPVTSKSVNVPMGWVPDKVSGQNAAEAWEAVEAVVADAVGRCTFSGVICPSCGGAGMVAHDATEGVEL